MLTAVRVALAEDEGCATIRHPPLEKKQYEYSIHKSANESKADEPGAKPSVSIVPSEAAESARLLERVRGLEAALVQERRADTGIANESEDGAVHIVGTKSASQKETARSSMTVAELQQLLADAEEARAQANFAMEASNARLAEVEGKLTLYFDGADLDQLQEKHRVQDEKIAEYELLLQQTSAEVVELQSELRAKVRWLQASVSLLWLPTLYASFSALFFHIFFYDYPKISLLLKMQCECLHNSIFNAGYNDAKPVYTSDTFVFDIRKKFVRFLRWRCVFFSSSFSNP